MFLFLISLLHRDSICYLYSYLFISSYVADQYVSPECYMRTALRPDSDLQDMGCYAPESVHA